MEKIIKCDAHLVNGEHVPATGHSSNPEWAGYNLCDKCLAEYNNRQPIEGAGLSE